MNIALFTDSYLPAKNGVITSIIQLKENLKNRGHSVIIITAETPGFPQENDVFTFPSIPAYKNLDLRYSLVNRKKLRAILYKHKTDIVHIHSEFAVSKAGIYAAGKLGLPLLYSCHTFYMYYKHYVPLGALIPDWYIDGMYRRYTRHFDAVVCPSEKMKQYLNRVNPGVETYIIPNSLYSKTIDENEIEKNTKYIKEKINYNENDFIITYTGRISKEKKVKELVTLLHPLLKSRPGLKLVLAGDGPDSGPIRSYCAKHSLPVYHLGYISWNEVMGLLKVSDLFVTLSQSEVNPMTVIEAAVSGIPAVVRDVKAVSNSITNGKNGILLEDDAKITEEVFRLITEPAYYKKLKEGAALKGKQIRAREPAGEFILLYKKIIERKK